MTQELLNKILSDHKKWLLDEPGGRRANLRGADLRRADLSDANLRLADLRRADLSDANLRCADLSGANLSDANLRGANLSDANLRRADLSGANLSGAKNLISAVNYLDANFEKTSDGFIVYKTFGGQYQPNKEWKIEQGSIINEAVNPNRTDICGCGINVAPIKWVKEKYKGDIWKCLIRWEWLAGVVVPYDTDGKIRCERVELVEVVK